MATKKPRARKTPAGADPVSDRNDWAVLPGTESRDRPIRIPADLVPLLQPLESLEPDQANPRTTKPGGVEHLVGLLESFGWTDPVVVAPDGKIEAGHQRRAAAVALGATHVPVVRTWHEGLDVPRFNIAHNRSQERVAQWDDAALAQWLRHLQEEDAAADLGWTDDQLERLLGTEGDASGEGDDRLVNFVVMVECLDEHQQAELFTRLEAEGFKVKMQML